MSRRVYKSEAPNEARSVIHPSNCQGNSHNASSASVDECTVGWYNPGFRPLTS